MKHIHLLGIYDIIASIIFFSAASIKQFLKVLLCL